MIVARAKKQENICEYLLYMWQVEDLIRAADCDIDRIEALILPRYSATESQLAEIKQWYSELADMMRAEGKQHSGHLDINRIVLMQLQELHRTLLADPKEYVYAGLHYQILPAVIQLRGKSAGQEADDLETSFNAVYGYLTLSLQGKPISEETKKSIKQISTFLAMLAHKHKQQTEAEQNPTAEYQ